MDANTFATLAIAGTVIFVVGYDRAKRLFQSDTPQTTSAATPEIIAQIIGSTSQNEETPIMPSKEWLDYVNNVASHTMLLGGTGVGKTTTALAILKSRGGMYAIISPKPSKVWHGLAFTTINDDLSYEACNSSFVELYAELKRRNRALGQNTLTANTVTIVFDDFSVLQNECENATETVRQIARLGREVGMRLILLSDSGTVRSLHLEGEGSTRNNFCVIGLARDHSGDLRDDYDSKDRKPIDTKLVRAIASAPRQLVAWQSQVSNTDFVAELLQVSSVSHYPLRNEQSINGVTKTNGSNEAFTPLTTVVSNEIAVSNETVTPIEAAQIATLLTKHSPSEAAKRLYGYTPTRYAEFKAKVETVQAMLEGA